MYATSAKVEQYSGPEFAAIKKKLETLKESNSELKDAFLLFTEVTDNKLELIQKAIEGIKVFVNETEPRCRGPTASALPTARCRRRWALGSEAQAGDNPCLHHVVVHVLQGVKAKVPFRQFLLNHG
ncbi:unnamed protein product [Boreogadus saida]